MTCVTIARRAWPSFLERNSIYHIFCKHFSDTCFVAELDGGVRGFLLGFLSQTNRDQAYIHLVAVDPDCQRRGIARTLYQTFTQAVRKMGRRRINLIVNPDNIPSLAFHEGLGFQADVAGTVLVDGTLAVRDYNGPGEHMTPLYKDI